MALVPESLRSDAYQIWTAGTPGNPPTPTTQERVDLWALDDKGNVQHKWWDGLKWNGWENLGQP